MAANIGTIEKLAEWASDGGDAVIAPSAAEIAAGWQPGDQPPAEYENWKNQRDEQKTNELIDLHDLHAENDYVDTIADRCSGIPSVTALLNPVSSANRLALDDLFGEMANAGAVSICRGYDYTQSKECVFGLCAAPDTYHKIFKFYNAGKTLQYKRVTTNIPDSVFAVDLCCDGDYIFVLCDGHTETPSVDIYRIPIGEGYTHGICATYDEHIHIGATRVTGKNTGYLGKGGKRICVADVDNVAFIDDLNDEVVIVAKTLATADSGSGTASVLPGTFTGAEIIYRSICSDGKRIWYTLSASNSEVSATVEVLCAALISNPTSATADLTRSWATDAPFWISVLSDDPDFVAIASQALVWDGASVNVLTAGRYLETHGAWIAQFDVESEFWFSNRYWIKHGRNITDGVNHTGGMCFTGRRLAPVFLFNPYDEISEPAIWDECNEFQFGVSLLNPYLGGVNNVDWDLSYTEIRDDRILTVETNSPVDDDRRIADVVFSDDSLWLLRYTFADEAATVDHYDLIRIPALSARG